MCFFISVAVKKNAWRQEPFVHLVLLKLTVPGLWRLYFGVLSRQISFWTFLELQLTILACKLHVSCACCVNIKFRVHVYSVFVWISLDSLVAVAVSVCRFSFASAGAEMTCAFLIQLVFCKKKKEKPMWFTGVEVEQETSAPPPKKNPGSAPGL